MTRHAERASDAANADLSPAGRERAEALAAIARAHAVRAVYTTDLCRTAQTGEPAARATGSPLRVVSTGSGAAGLDACTPALSVPRAAAGGAAPADVATDIRTRFAGGAVLVVGHSNTVPALIEALTGRSPCPSLIPLDGRQRCFLDEAAYGDVFVVHLPAAGDAHVELRRAGR